MDWVTWDIGEVYEMARAVRDLLVSSFNAVLPVFLLVLLIVYICMVVHWLFGKDGIL